MQTSVTGKTILIYWFNMQENQIISCWDILKLRHTDPVLGASDIAYLDLSKVWNNHDGLNKKTSSEFEIFFVSWL